jgi:hypothetical protein
MLANLRSSRVMDSASKIVTPPAVEMNVLMFVFLIADRDLLP